MPLDLMDQHLEEYSGVMVGIHGDRQARPHAMRRVWPWHTPRGKDAGTQTPTATPEGGRLHDLLCTCRQSHVGGLHLLGSGEATSAPPHGRASRGEEERYSGYFSCFVTRKII